MNFRIWIFSSVSVGVNLFCFLRRNRKFLLDFFIILCHLRLMFKKFGFFFSNFIRLYVFSFVSLGLQRSSIVSLSFYFDVFLSFFRFFEVILVRWLFLYLYLFCFRSLEYIWLCSPNICIIMGRFIFLTLSIEITTTVWALFLSYLSFILKTLFKLIRFSRNRICLFP